MNIIGIILIIMVNIIIILGGMTIREIERLYNMLNDHCEKMNRRITELEKSIRGYNEHI